MQSDIFDFKSLMDKPDFGIKRYKNATYKGQINENQHRHGLGIQTSDIGRVYEGSWLDDQRSGEGYEIYKTGGYYRGEFLSNKPHGKGTYFWANGEVFEGEWDQAKK